jgi:AcrR family transcriptional regulator
MVRQRFDNLDIERQEHILSAAADEFAERGFDGASLSRIVRRAGTSKGALYYYFEDKSDLFSTVMERATAPVLQLVAGFSLEGLTAETYWAAFEAFSRRSFEYLNGHAWYVRLVRSLYRLRLRSGPSGPTAPIFDWARTWATRILSRGQELGVVRADFPLPFLVDATLALGEVEDRWLFEQWEALSAPERERWLVAEMRLTRRLLEPEAGA